MANTAMTTNISSISSASLQDMHGCIIDYACRHRLLDVIHEVCKRHEGSLSALGVSHTRLASAGLYKMVVSNCEEDFPTALLLVEQLFTAAGSSQNKTLVRNYAKLLCGLKVKCLFHCLQSCPQQALAVLRKYFPREGDVWDKELALSNPSLAIELRNAAQDFRKSFLPLIAHEHKRENFMKNEYEGLYGSDFSRCLVRRVTTFLTELEKDLPDTFIDKLLKGGVEETGTSTGSLSSAMMSEMLLECVEGKTTLPSADLVQLVEDLSSQTTPSLQGFQHTAMHISMVSSPEEGMDITGDDQRQNTVDVCVDDGPSTNSLSARADTVDCVDDGPSTNSLSARADTVDVCVDDGPSTNCLSARADTVDVCVDDGPSANSLSTSADTVDVCVDDGPSTNSLSARADTVDICVDDGPSANNLSTSADTVMNWQESSDDSEPLLQRHEEVEVSREESNSEICRQGNRDRFHLDCTNRARLRLRPNDQRQSSFEKSNMESRQHKIARSSTQDPKKAEYSGPKGRALRPCRVKLSYLKNIRAQHSTGILQCKLFT